MTRWDDPYDDLLYRRHSLRNFEPDEFLELWNRAKENGNYENMKKVRRALKNVESGRFHEMLGAAHKVVRHLDPDEIRTFYKQHPRLMKWINVYGHIEELPRFYRYSPY